MKLTIKYIDIIYFIQSKKEHMNVSMLDCEPGTPASAVSVRREFRSKSTQNIDLTIFLSTIAGLMINLSTLSQLRTYTRHICIS